MAVISNTTARRIIGQDTPDHSNLAPADIALIQGWLSQLREAARDGLHVEVSDQVAAALARAGIAWQ